HAGGDVGTSHSWRAGLSSLRTRTDDIGSSVLYTRIADFVWKWAPNGNPHTTNFKLQGEYMRTTVGQSGWYLQGVYQFMPMWRVGARYDRLDAGDTAVNGLNPQRVTAMVDWSPSEFSRLRLQYARAGTQTDVADNQRFVQYILSLGAHGAHKFGRSHHEIHSCCNGLDRACGVLAD